MKRFFTSREVGDICGMSVPTVLKRHGEGLLQGHKTQGRRGTLRVSRKYLLAFMRRIGAPLEEIERYERQREGQRGVCLISPSASRLADWKEHLRGDRRLRIWIRRWEPGISSLKIPSETNAVVVDGAGLAPGRRGALPRLPEGARLVLCGGASGLRAAFHDRRVEAHIDAGSGSHLRSALYRLLGLERRHV